MENILVKTKDLDRSNWLQYRKLGIGGSDVGAICGLNKYKSPIAVYLDKIGELPNNDEQSEAAYWGNVLEEIVAREFQIRTGKKVRHRNAMLKHTEYPWMLANLDRVVVGEKAILECKTTSAYMDQEWKDDKVPESYILQCQHYMAVTGFSKCYIAALIGGNKFVWKEIKRDEELISYLIAIEKDFWINHIEKKIPPSIDGSESSTEVLKVLYPESIEDSETLLDYEAGELVQKRLELKEQEKEVKNQLNEVENKLKAKLQSYEVGKVDNFKITWKSINSSKLDNKTLKQEQPEIYKKYCKVSSYRKFEIKEVL